jgi:hypothetical protein
VQDKPEIAGSGTVLELSLEYATLPKLLELLRELFTPYRIYQFGST